MHYTLSFFVYCLSFFVLFWLREKYEKENEVESTQTSSDATVAEGKTDPPRGNTHTTNTEINITSKSHSESSPLAEEALLHDRKVRCGLGSSCVVARCSVPVPVPKSARCQWPVAAAGRCLPRCLRSRRPNEE